MSSSKKTRVHVSGYKTCPYFQRAVRLWQEYARQQGDDVEVRVNGYDTREQYKTAIGGAWATSPYVTISHDGSSTERIGGYDESKAWIDRRARATPSPHHDDDDSDLEELGDEEIKCKDPFVAVLRVDGIADEDVLRFDRKDLMSTVAKACNTRVSTYRYLGENLVMMTVECDPGLAARSKAIHVSPAIRLTWVSLQNVQK